MAMAGMIGLASPAGAEDLATRTHALLEGQGAPEGGLPVEAVCVVEPGGSAQGGVPSDVRCILQAVVSLTLEQARHGAFEVALGLGGWEDLAEVRRASLQVPALDAAAAVTAPGDPVTWVLLAPVELDEDHRGVAVAVGLEGADAWGGGLAALADEPLEIPPGAVLTEVPQLLEGARDTPSPQGAASAGARLLRIVPPPTRPGTRLEGSTRFDVLTSSDSVDRVVFLLDGKPQDEDRRPPFAGRLGLAKPAREQTVTAVAYDAQGKTLGTDTLTVNTGGAPFSVTISALIGEPGAGAVEVTAETSVPPGSQLARLAFFFNEVLAEEVKNPGASVTATVPTPSAGPEDYVRVLAELADGSTIDSVRLLAARGTVEEVQVNLQELYVVVTDEAGEPAADLKPEDFEVLLDGQRQTLESVSFAQDVPLHLGLVIDTSGSMEQIMAETKQAAAGFLAEVLGDDDRAFLVAFDTRPMLAQESTGDLMALLGAFGQLQPGGFTATYDSILFSLLQLGDEPGRKALVLLTDGEDYRSRFSPRRAIRDARTAGVPVYIIGLGIGDERRMQRVYKNSDLNDVAAETGGRVFLVSELAQLGGAYAKIERELRSQYLLTFYPPEAPAPGAKPPAIEVKVRREGLEVRTVVGAARR